MLKLAAESDELKVVADQFGATTGAQLIADVTALSLYRVITNSAISERFNCIYHLTASGKTSWHEYAKLILGTAIHNNHSLRISPEQVDGIMTKDYPLPAKRPMNSCLETEKNRSVFKVNLASWREHVERAVLEIAV